MIKEVIIVEGRDDTRRLKEVFGDVDTIETQGSAVPESILSQIERIAETRDVVVLTDPDFNGERIRKKVLEIVPQAKQAFLPRREARPHNRGSLGVEHASAEALQASLKNMLTTTSPTETAPVISQSDLADLGLIAGVDAKTRREQLGDYLHIGYANGKQLARKLQMFQITPQELKDALTEMGLL
ncbi:ribonuclease M5 [Lapidilactobacillus bayanensis]|uniref:ribonuclease M5 n=1 Tax=Lapidilactobacillus bayanensis TaxID=2485998 RepID=UPI000F78059C|nr:ribonuclease M5 [Lapidilactobacillus bayanensis]